MPALTLTSQVEPNNTVPETTISASANLDIGSNITSKKDEMTLLYVPEGEFQMGSNNGDPDEIPVHAVFLNAYWIDQTEVKNNMYSRCVMAGVCQPPQKTRSDLHLNYYGTPKFDTFPVIYVDWDMARTYCEWAERRLPTEAEWEKAARGTKRNNYPWGDIFDGKALNFCDKNCTVFWANKSFDDGYSDVAPVGSYPAGKSPYGVLDMAGNVWEWVYDWYGKSYYAESPRKNPIGPTLLSGQYRVGRGGAKNMPSAGVRSANRDLYLPSSANSNLGFRCVMSATP